MFLVLIRAYHWLIKNTCMVLATIRAVIRLYSVLVLLVCRREFARRGRWPSTDGGFHLVRAGR